MDIKEFIINTNNELIAKGNFDIIGTAFQSSYIAHNDSKTYSGHDFVKKWTKSLRSAISNLKVLEIKVLSENKNTITWQRRISGIHSGNFKAIPPSGKKITWNEILVSEIKDGKFQEEWVVSELAGKLLSYKPKSKK